jgi:hypothetical protein
MMLESEDGEDEEVKLTVAHMLKRSYPRELESMRRLFAREADTHRHAREAEHPNTALFKRLVAAIERLDATDSPFATGNL